MKLVASLERILLILAALLVGSIVYFAEDLVWLWFWWWLGVL